MRKYLAIAWTLIFISLAGAAIADSVLTLPVPEDIFLEGPDFSDVAHMVLRVSVPSKDEQPPPRIKEPKAGFDYFDFNPFPEVPPQDLAIIRRLTATNLHQGKFLPGRLNLMFKTKGREPVSSYEFLRGVRIIMQNFLGLTDKAVVSQFKLTRKNLEDIERLATEYASEMETRHIEIKKVKEKLAHVRHLLELNQGVARVIKVENDESGATVIHFLVRNAPEE